MESTRFLLKNLQTVWTGNVLDLQTIWLNGTKAKIVRRQSSNFELKFLPLLQNHSVIINQSGRSTFSGEGNEIFCLRYVTIISKIVEIVNSRTYGPQLCVN